MNTLQANHRAHHESGEKEKGVLCKGNCINKINGQFRENVDRFSSSHTFIERIRKRGSCSVMSLSVIISGECPMGANDESEK